MLKLKHSREVFKVVEQAPCILFLRNGFIKNLFLALWTWMLCLYTGSTLAHSGIEEEGGSVYLGEEIDPRALEVSENWKLSSIFHNPMCASKAEMSSIKIRMAEMYGQGQRKLGFMLWHAHLDPSISCAGFLLNSGSSKEVDQVANRLGEITLAAQEIGFNEIQIRFAPQWVNDPKTWKVWYSDMFWENFHFEQAILNKLDHSHLSVLIDMGTELGGLEQSQFVKRYVQEFWRQKKVVLFGCKSYGFSIAAQKGRLSRYIQWLRDVGDMPSQFAVDVYDDVENKLSFLVDEANQEGVSSPNFMIQETYYDDKNVLADILRAMQEKDMHIRTVMQWPLRSNHKTAISEMYTPTYIYRTDSFNALDRHP